MSLPISVEIRGRITSMTPAEFAGRQDGKTPLSASLRAPLAWLTSWQTGVAATWSSSFRKASTCSWAVASALRTDRSNVYSSVSVAPTSHATTASITPSPCIRTQSAGATICTASWISASVISMPKTISVSETNWATSGSTTWSNTRRTSVSSSLSLSFKT